MPGEIYQIRTVFAVVDRECGIEADLRGIVAQQPCADAVKRAGPGQRIGDDLGIPTEHFGGDPLDPLRHLRRGAAGEGHQENASRVRALDDQMRNAVRQRVGFAGTRAGDHQKRSCDTARPMLDRPPLLGIQLGEIGRLESRITSSEVHPDMKHRLCFVRNGFGSVGRASSSHSCRVPAGISPRNHRPAITVSSRAVAHEALKRGDVAAIGVNYTSWTNGVRDKDTSTPPGAFRVIARSGDLPQRSSRHRPRLAEFGPVASRTVDLSVDGLMACYGKREPAYQTNASCIRVSTPGRLPVMTARM